ncbi:MAG: hypothetical protein CBB71_02635 [Rhodopirellula sp. TMED11]|nr:MAG: hypothetical protein CBB71_02635 [Rhodopirellula sp. TMED11]
MADERLLESDDPTRQKFLAGLEKEIGTRGVIDLNGRGTKFDHHDIELFYGTPSPGNAKPAELFAGNRFSITRQLRYSLDESGRSLDLEIFIKRLPIAIFELRNNLTIQDIDDAVAQDSDPQQRNPKERPFAFGRCIVHFAIDDGLIIDVLKYYTPVASDHRLSKTIRCSIGNGRKRSIASTSNATITRSA